MPTNKQNSIAVKAMGLVFSLFYITSTWEVPFVGIPQYTQCIIHDFTSVLLCVPLVFADSKKCLWVLAHDGFLCIMANAMESICLFIEAAMYDNREKFFICTAG